MTTTVETVAPVAAVAAPAAPKVDAAPAKVAKAAAPAKPKTVTKAIRTVKMGTTKAKAVKVADATITVVSTKSSVRIDHSACKHETKGAAGKKARAACRDRAERALKVASK